MADRRLLSLIIVLAAVAAPAAALRATCIGGSCHREARATLSVPICDVPRETRRLLAAGYSQQTSPDVIALSSAGPSRGGGEARVPLVFWGMGIRAGRLTGSADLSDVTPTLERLLGITPGPFPSAQRLGTALPVVARGTPPHLVLEIVWRGLGTRDLGGFGATPFLHRLMHDGSGTMRASTGSLPADPVPLLTTLGTGSPPSEHGVTGTVMRSPYTDDLVRGWNPNETPSALPTLANDLLRYGGAGSRAVLVAPDERDGGIVGADFYVGAGRPSIVVRPGAANRSRVEAALSELRSGLGAGSGTDLLVVILNGAGSFRPPEAATRTIVAAATRTAGGSLTGVLTATGSPPVMMPSHVGSDRTADLLAARLGRPAIAASSAGGFFLRPGVSAQEVATALLRIHLIGIPHLFSDAFPTYALSLAGFC